MSTNNFSAEGGQNENQVVIVINLEELALKGHQHPEHDPGVIIHYRIKVDGQFFEVKQRHMIGSAILALAGKTPANFKLIQVKHVHGHPQEVVIAPDEVVDFGTYGIERFITKPITYHFFIDMKEYHTTEPSLTVRQILEDYAKVDPANKTLAKKVEGGFHEYTNLNEEVPLDNCPHFTLFDNCPTNVS